MDINLEFRLEWLIVIKIWGKVWYLYIYLFVVVYIFIVVIFGVGFVDDVFLG